MAQPPFDIEIAAFLLDGNERQPDLARIARRFLHVDITPEEMTPGMIGAIIAPLHKELEKELRERNIWDLYNETEVALVPVLARMENLGVKLDLPYLAALSKDLHKQLEVIEKEIYSLSGEEFNIQSPKQLQVILFEKLQLASGKKTKTGLSTNVQVLTELAEVHPLPAKILEYRHLAKLLSTYIDALPRQADRNARVHTTYNQTIASTGRLSSIDPNLQNIPIRTDIGRKIRKAFIPEDGCIFLAADYSQIELRLLAHFSGDPQLVEAFSINEDVHTRTATLIFQKKPEEVLPEERRIAKTVNFGVVYGMGPFKLSQDLRIPLKEAKSFIDAYFERYAKVSDFMRGLETQARDEGYLFTLLGRSKSFPGLTNRNKVIYEAAKREAMNYPLQGSAADIIKRAMITLDADLQAQGYKARIVLQVHDELVIELPKDEAEAVTKLVVQHMEDAVELAVPLKVEVGMGASWFDAH